MAARTREACSRSAAVASARARAAGLGLCLLVKPRVADRGGHQPDQPPGELELLVVVRRALVHQLHDAHDLALLLDGEHHRRLHPGRALVRELLHPPFAIDVVVDAGRVLHLLRNVVDEKWLSADDHAALHAAAGSVERELGEDRGVELLAVDPGVLAADQLGLRIEGRDDHAAVGDGVAEQLAESVVDALRLQRLVQVPRGG